jgi:hypothetical protein
MQSTNKGRRDSRRVGIIRPLGADDPRDLNHPCHREQWLELARAIGRLEAREEFHLLQQQNAGLKPDDKASETTEDRRTLRPIFKRHAKKALD